MVDFFQDVLREAGFGDWGPVGFVGVDRQRDGVFGCEEGRSFLVNLAAGCEEGWGYSRGDGVAVQGGGC